MLFDQLVRLMRLSWISWVSAAKWSCMCVCVCDCLGDENEADPLIVLVLHHPTVLLERSNARMSLNKAVLSTECSTSAKRTKVSRLCSNRSTFLFRLINCRVSTPTRRMLCFHDGFNYLQMKFTISVMFDYSYDGSESYSYSYKTDSNRST